MNPLNTYIDHTNLSAFSTPNDIQKLCDEALQYQFASVCVNSAFVPLVSKELKDSQVKVCTVVGFPLGQMDTESKVFEARQAVANGANEIDMVIHIGQLLSGNVNYVEEEIAKIKKGIGDCILKVIIETCYLKDEQKVLACQLSVNAGADFVKTSTGFGTAGASFEDVQLMLDTVGSRAKVKASGGIRDKETALRYIEMGVSRLGTSSGVKLVSE